MIVYIAPVCQAPQFKSIVYIMSSTWLESYGGNRCGIKVYDVYNDRSATYDVVDQDEIMQCFGKQQ
jgi:hypothetical protein